MAIVPWVIDEVKLGVMRASITLTDGDTSDELSISDYSDKTIHIVPDDEATVLGSNGVGTPQALHRANDPTLSFSAVSGEVLATIIENPMVIVASASGDDATIVIIARDQKD